MLMRPFGSTGRDVSIIGQGTWQLKDPKRAEAALRTGLDLGLTHIDTAELYAGSEEVVARVLGPRRDEVFVVSKVLPRNASYRGTLEHCDQSLRRLQTDRLDVYLLHWVTGDHPVEDTFRAMGELADQGKIRAVGVSNHSIEQVEEAQSALGPRHRIVCNQVYYDLVHRHIESELVPWCAKNQIAVVGYSPFGSGRGELPGVTGKAAKTLEVVAARHKMTKHQVVLNFLSRRPNVFLIPKAEKEEHVRSNAAALDVRLTEGDVAELDAAFPVPDRARELPMI